MVSRDYIGTRFLCSLLTPSEFGVITGPRLSACALLLLPPLLLTKLWGMNAKSPHLEGHGDLVIMEAIILFGV